MRKDVEEKYDQMMSAPQKIIFSESKPGDVEELIPARVTSKGEEVFDAIGDDDGFQLGDGVSSQQQSESDQSGDEFELDAIQAVVSQQAAPAPAVTPPVTPPAAPPPAAPPAAAPPAAAQSAAVQPAGETAPQPSATPPAEIAQISNSAALATDAASSGTDQPDGKNVNDDDFAGMALSEVKETQQRKRRKVQQSRRRRVLVPCTTCGAWIRVFQDQAGRTVRCQKCKTPFLVPQLKKKDKKAKGSEKGAGITLEWLEDVMVHVVNPTDIVLKPGSMEKGEQPADITFHDGQMYVVKFGLAAKKGLFGKIDPDQDVPAQRRQIRDAIGKSGNLNSVPVGECMPLTGSQANNLKLVQPVSEAHASMFAGVPVFGSGKVAVYLPIAQPDNQQIFMSMTLSQSLQMAAALREKFAVELQLAENGVPETEQKEMLKCKLVEVPVEAIRNVEYYENDPQFELEMTGHRCGTCQIVISEDGRARKKLGGAAGKGIAKAKCPSCSAKMGGQKTYRISKSPTDAEDKE